jgi:hypothetical protein
MSEVLASLLRQLLTSPLISPLCLLKFDISLDIATLPTQVCTATWLAPKWRAAGATPGTRKLSQSAMRKAATVV